MSVHSGTKKPSNCILNPMYVTKNPSPNCKMPRANLIGMLGFLPIDVSLSHIQLKTEPNKMMNAGLKNCVIDAGMVQPKISRLTFLSANKVSDVPACSKHAQNTILISMKMTNAIILWPQTLLSLKPPRMREKATMMNKPVNK